MNAYQVILAVIILMLIAMIPVFIAKSRKSQHTIGILILCTFFGWTLVGFIGGIIWAVLSPVESEIRRSNAKAQNKLNQKSKNCPMCAESVMTAATLCRFCGHEFIINNKIVKNYMR